MSQAPNDGGPAFASPSDYATCMSLLDYFAGQALAGLTTRGFYSENKLAESAYKAAEAMLSYKQNQEAVSESQQVALGIGGET